MVNPNQARLNWVTNRLNEAYRQENKLILKKNVYFGFMCIEVTVYCNKNFVYLDKNTFIKISKCFKPKFTILLMSFILNSFFVVSFSN